MAVIKLTSERINRIVEMVNATDVFVIKFSDNGKCITSAYNGHDRLNFDTAGLSFIYHEGETIDIEIFRRDDVLIF